MGDAGGGVCIMQLTTASAHHFGLQFGIHDKHRIPFPELVHHKHDGVKVTYISTVLAKCFSVLPCFAGQLSRKSWEMAPVHITI